MLHHDNMFSAEEMYIISCKSTGAVEGRGSLSRLTAQRWCSQEGLHAKCIRSVFSSRRVLKQTIISPWDDITDTQLSVGENEEGRQGSVGSFDSQLIILLRDIWADPFPPPKREIADKNDIFCANITVTIRYCS